MFLKKKLTKNVWYQRMKWRVEQILEPNKFDTFLLLSREIDNMIHPDSKVIPIDMVLIDVHNHTFYPDTKKVRGMIAKIQKAKEVIQSLEGHSFAGNSNLDNIWLDMFDHSV